MLQLNEKEISVLNEVKNFVPTDEKQYAMFSSNNSVVKTLVEKGLVLVQVNPKNKLKIDVILSEAGIAHFNNNNVQEEVKQVQQTTEKVKTMFQLEDNAVMPQTKRLSKFEYPLAQMQVGQSFVLPFDHLGFDEAEAAQVLGGDKDVSDKLMRKARWRINTYKKSVGLVNYSFRFRIEDKGVRVWLYSVTDGSDSE